MEAAQVSGEGLRPVRKLNSRGRAKLVMEIDEPLIRDLKTESAKRGTSMRAYVTALIEHAHREETGRAQ